jgi:CDP-ribitol ribitolphosphotransferase
LTTIIHNISWKRIYFEIEYSSDDEEPLFLYRVKERRFVPFTTEDIENGKKIARLNITLACGREPLSAGEWIIAKKIDVSKYNTTQGLLDEKPYLYNRLVKSLNLSSGMVHDSVEEEVLSVGLDLIAEKPYDVASIEYENSILENLEDYSRIFRYGGKYAYAVILKPKKDYKGDVFLLLDVVFFKKNNNPLKREHSIRYIEKKILNKMYKMLSFFIPKKGNTILFLKQNGDNPTDNMQALQKRMHERGIDKEFKLIFRYRNIFSGKQNIFEWIKDFYAIARSDYIFIDDYTPILNFIDIDKKTVLTQIWHAGVGFKSVGYARFGLRGSPDPYASSHRKYTYALVGNKHLRQIYSEVFGIEESALLATGMPRLDHFLDDRVRQCAETELSEKYQWMKTGKVILFAPTFRGTGQKEAHYPYEYIDMDALYEICKKTNSYFVFKMHHFIIGKPEIKKCYADRILDLSSENLNKLFYISDVLITDYSSCFYDYILLNKPVIFFTPDRLAYTAIRGVQRPIKEMAPGPVCDSFEQLLNVLANNAYNKQNIPIDMLDRAIEKNKFASDRVIDFILFGKDDDCVKKKDGDATTS